jgi:hypothetical protein|tara:strand:- start:688 stop:912 length:225 start_codon:yes stop_codon:yes gene_type:complete
MANLMMLDADPEFKAYLKERAKKEATTDYHSLKADFEDWKKHRKPKGAYLGTFISGGPGGSNPTYRKYYKGMLD